MVMYLQKQFLGGYWGVLFSTLQFKKNSIYSNKRQEQKNKNRKQTNMTPQNPPALRPWITRKLGIAFMNQLDTMAA
jgi:hypothetical protein